MAGCGSTRLTLSVTLVAWLASASAAVLLAAIVWAASESSLSEGLRAIASDRWGIVTLIDVYAGVLVVATWIRAREPRTGVWLAWVAGLICLGHLVSLVYLAICAWRARRVEELFPPPRL